MRAIRQASTSSAAAGPAGQALASLARRDVAWRGFENRSALLFLLFASKSSELCVAVRSCASLTVACVRAAFSREHNRTVHTCELRRAPPLHAIPLLGAGLAGLAGLAGHGKVYEQPAGKGLRSSTPRTPRTSMILADQAELTEHNGQDPRPNSLRAVGRALRPPASLPTRLTTR